MEVKIKEHSVKFIECGECGYERSCMYPESIRYGTFSWYCPKCSRLWWGRLEKDGSLVIDKMSELSERQYVLIEVSRELTPWMLVASKNEVPKKEWNSPSTTETLHLNPAESDIEINPHSFPQYRADTF